MTVVTDPEILRQFEEMESLQNSQRPQTVTDPEILAQFERLEKQQQPQQEAPEWLQQLNSNPLLGFAREMGNQVVSAPGQMANMVLPESMQLRLPKLIGEQNPAGGWGRIGGGIANMAALGAPAFAARGLAEGIPYLGRAAKALGGSGALSSMGRVGLGTGAYEASQNPENRIGAGMLGGLGGAGGAGLMHALGAFRPSNMFANKNLTPEELRRNVLVAGETGTGLGDILESPSLKRLKENVLDKTPFSAADKISSDTANFIQDEGKNIIKKYLGDIHPNEASAELGKSLTDAYNRQRSLSRSLYSTAENEADRVGLKLNLPKFSSKSKEYIDLLKDKHFLQSEPESKKLLADIDKFTSIGRLKESPKLTLEDQLAGRVKKQEFEYPTLRESNIFASRLNDIAKRYRSSPVPQDRHIGGILGDLGKTLKEDIRDTIEISGDRELKNSFFNAEKNYKDNFSKFFDKDVYKFISGNRSPEDLVNKFINKSPSSDKSDQLKKLTNVLDDKGKNLLKYSYLAQSLKNEEGRTVLKPNTLKNLFSNNLGENQRLNLFNNPEEYRELSDFSKLTSMNQDAIYRMFNPQTGQRNLDKALKLLPGVGGSVSGYGIAGAPGAIVGMAAGALGPGLASRFLTHYLTSPKVRANIVEKMIKNAKKGNSGKEQTENIGIGMGSLIGSIPRNSNEE